MSFKGLITGWLRKILLQAKSIKIENNWIRQLLSEVMK